MSKKPIINAHAHVFTGKFVPPFLARSIVPWPLYFLLRTNWVVSLAKRYYDCKNSLRFPRPNQNSDAEWNAIYKRRKKIRTKTMLHFYIRERPFLYIPYNIVIFYLSFVTLIYLVEFLEWILCLNAATFKVFINIKKCLIDVPVLFKNPLWGKILWVLVVLIFIDWSRRVILMAIKKLSPLISSILSPKGIELLQRYLLMGRFAMYGSQKIVAQRALSQLPPESQLVILPMDMEYMGAGKTKITKKIKATQKINYKKGWIPADYKNTYTYQMREIWEFVEARRASKTKPQQSYHPFLFLDPRRIKEEGLAFFSYTINKGRMKLDECFVKTYMEDRAFSGFKMYPALGYYPFDEHLLPIWRYACENNIPIMTHCILGVIYDRGNKKKEWNFHPVFKQHYADIRNPKNKPLPMLLPQVKAVDRQINFTHPMNYLCLLEEKLLRELVANATNDSIRTLFGFTEIDTPLTYSLRNLKICLAHYGGEDEWNKYLETDRDVYTPSIITKPNEGIQLLTKNGNKLSWPKINSIWHDTDWYSIITSILMQYPNMYADLSYIISKPSIYPLLNETLRKGDGFDKQHAEYLKEPSDNLKASKFKGRNRLRSHILYGTDFYVVRNHHSDKDLFVETRAALDDESFDLIARENTHNYLSRS